MFFDDDNGDMGVLVLCSPRGKFVFDIFVVDTYSESYDGRHPQMSHHKWRKKGRYLVAFL